MYGTTLLFLFYMLAVKWLWNSQKAIVVILAQNIGKFNEALKLFRNENDPLFRGAKEQVIRAEQQDRDTIMYTYINYQVAPL